jgi:hypothetical protein
MFGEIPMMFHLQLAVRQGFEHFNGSFILKEIIVPVNLYLLDLVLVPFFVSRAIASIAYRDNYLFQTTVIRYAHLVYISFLVAEFVGAQTMHWLVRIHNDIRDTTLLNGAQLANR